MAVIHPKNHNGIDEKKSEQRKLEIERMLNKKSES